MLSKNDVTMLRGMFGELLEENNHILKRENRDEMHALIKASEAGIIRRVDVMEERILDAVGSVVDLQISPRLYDCEQQILKLKQHVQLV